MPTLRGSSSTQKAKYIPAHLNGGPIFEILLRVKPPRRHSARVRTEAD